MKEDVDVKAMDAPGYALDNTAPTGDQILHALATILDPGTIAALTAAGVGPGWRCLELGAGNASVARWMHGRVGPTGRVTAVDIDDTHLRKHPDIHSVRLDLRTDPLPPGRYDLIHARLLLAHLPNREQLLTAAAALLKPGRPIVVEEWGQYGPAHMLSSPNPDGPALYEAYQEALLHVFRSRGNDTTWCAQVPTVMRAAGLVGVDTTVTARLWTGGTAGCHLPIAVSTELETQLAGTGLLTTGDLTILRTLLADPDTVVSGNLTWTSTGHKPI